MLIQPIDYFLVGWFVLAAASTVYVGVDQYLNNPEPAVMKWGFILVTLYMGPLGLLLYVMADKEPRPGEHEAFIRPLWRQGVAAQSGTYFYHSHDHVDRQQALGLYGAMIIDPAKPDAELQADHEYTLMLQEWLLREGLNYLAPHEQQHRTERRRRADDAY